MPIHFSPNHPGKHRGRSAAGFSIIELMTVVGIIGILTAVALPSYLRSIERGDRAAARAGLLEASHFMERYYATNNRYSVAADGTGNPPLPDRLIYVPVESPRYKVSVSAVTSNTYTLTASPAKTVSMCGDLTLDNTGLKGISVPANASATDIAACWK